MLTDPRTLGEMPEFKLPEHFEINDNMVTPPASEAEMDSVEVLRGPNIKPFPETSPLDESINARFHLKSAIISQQTTLCPAGAKILPFAFKYSCYFTALLFYSMDEEFQDVLRTWKINNRRRF